MDTSNYFSQPVAAPIETSNGRMWLGDDGIIYDVVRNGAVTDLQAAKEDMAHARSLRPGQPLLILVDIRKSGDISREARMYYAKESKDVEALAMIVGSYASQMMARFFLMLSRPPFSVKIFTCEREAVEWLRGERA